MSSSPTLRSPRVAIIGAGMSGICMAIKLQQAGIEDVTIYEKRSAAGGTWRDNTYPGLHCDIPSRIYQYSFELNPTWTRFFSPGGEIQEYFAQVVEKYGINEQVVYDAEIVQARFEDGCWRLRTAQGREDTVDFLVAATGILHHPRVPQIEGLDTFAGSTFHSAQWDHSVPLEGQRVGVVGTGSTGVQIVTALSDVAAGVTMFQRTPQWIMPIPNPPIPRALRAAHRRIPGLSRLSHLAIGWGFGVSTHAVTEEGWQRRLINWAVRRNLRAIRDPGLRAKMTPDYQPMCKRLVVSAGFYPAIQRDHVEVATERIERIEPDGVRTADGRLHELDVLVLATGFDAHAFIRPVDLVGLDGWTLADAWVNGPRAYQTVALPGFPNFFMLMGPHSPVGNFPLTAIAESQADFILDWIERWRTGEFDSLAPTAEATAAFNASMKAAAPGTIWASGCSSWYLGADGSPEIWPWHPHRHRDLLRRPSADDFVFTRSDAAPAIVRDREPVGSIVPTGLLRLGIGAASRVVLSPRTPPRLQRLAGDVASLGARAPHGVRPSSGTLAGRETLVLRESEDPEPVAAVLWLHGGGYQVGSLRSHRALAAHVAAAAGLPVHLLDYRLAPEHPFPAGLDDALAAFRELVAGGQRVLVGGDSAGGGLALSLAMRLRDAAEVEPVGLALISPWVDLTAASSGLSRRDLMLRPSMLRAWADRYAAGRDVGDPMISPLYGDLTDLPPMLVHVGERESLHQDARRLVTRVRASGSDATLRTLPGMWHDAHLHAGLISPATEAVEEIGRFLAAAAFGAGRTQQPT